MIQLYLNNELCDLYGNEEIATDYSIAPISNISTRNSAKSITFKIPLTGNNREIIENNNVIVNSSTLPYTLIPARLEANGLDQKIEFAQLKSVKDDIELVLFGSNVDFFGIIKNLKLSDLGTDWNHVWNALNAYSSMDNTSGYIYALIDFHSDSPNIFIDNISAEINVKGLLPSVFLHSIITKIVTDAGFTASGDFLSNANYRSVILPCSTLNIGRYKSDLLSSASTSASIPPGIAAPFPLDTDNFDPLNLFFLDGGIYSYHTYLAGTYSFKLTFSWTGLGAPPAVIAIVNFDTSTVLSSFNINATSGTHELLAENIVLAEGDRIYATIADLGVTTTILAGATLEVTETQVAQTKFGKLFDVAANLPDLKQSELIKDTAQKFNLIIQVDNSNKIVYFRQFSEIIANIPNALDWSDKVDYMEKPEIQFDSDYGQRNLCTYTDDDTVIKPVGTDSEILIPNANLKPELELFESPFAASEQVLRFGGYSIAQIKIFTDLDGAEEEIADVEPRYLTIRYESFSAFILTDGALTLPVVSVPMTYFILPEQDFNLGFENNLLDYSADMIEMIQNFKLVKMLLKVNASDINQLDHFIPVWIEIKGQPGCYFYRSDLKQVKTGSAESTECELGKLP